MTLASRRPVVLVVALLLMCVGSAGPWATAHTWRSGVVATSGLDHGGVVVLVICGLIVLALAAGSFGAARGLALSALAWIALAGYELPGALVGSGAWQAELAWGIGIALLGSAVVVIAAGRPSVPR